MCICNLVVFCIFVGRIIWLIFIVYILFFCCIILICVLYVCVFILVLFIWLVYFIVYERLILINIKICLILYCFRKGNCVSIFGSLGFIERFLFLSCWGRFSRCIIYLIGFISMMMMEIFFLVYYFFLGMRFWIFLRYKNWMNMYYR